MSPKSVLCARVYATVGPTATKSSSESTDRLALDIIRSGTVGELQKCFFIIPSSSFQLSRNRESWFQARCVAQAGSEKLSDAYEFLGGAAPPDIFAVCRQGGASRRPLGKDLLNVCENIVAFPKLLPFSQKR